MTDLLPDCQIQRVKPTDQLTNQRITRILINYANLLYKTRKKITHPCCEPIPWLFHSLQHYPLLDKQSPLLSSIRQLDKVLLRVNYKIITSTKRCISLLSHEIAKVWWDIMWHGLWKLSSEKHSVRFCRPFPPVPSKSCSFPFHSCWTNS